MIIHKYLWEDIYYTYSTYGTSWEIMVMYLKISFELIKDAEDEEVEEVEVYVGLKINEERPALYVNELPVNVKVNQTIQANTAEKIIIDVYLDCDKYHDYLSILEIEQIFEKRFYQSFRYMSPIYDPSNPPPHEIVHSLINKWSFLKDLQRIFMRTSDEVKFKKDEQQAQELQEMILLDAGISYEKKSANKIIEEFESRFPKSEWWRLFVDGILYTENNPGRDSEGWKAYAAREPQCLENAFAAWSYCLDIIKSNPENKLINIEFIKNIQALCLAHKKEFVAIEKGDFKSKDDISSFQFRQNNLHCYSREGIVDLLETLKSGALKDAALLIRVPSDQWDKVEYFDQVPRSKIIGIPNSQLVRVINKLKEASNQGSLVTNHESNVSDISHTSEQTEIEREKETDICLAFQMASIEWNNSLEELKKLENEASFFIILDRKILDNFEKNKDRYNPQDYEKTCQEYIEKISQYVYRAIADDDMMVTYVAPMEGETKIEDLVLEIIDDYNNSINNCSSTDEEINCISTATQAFERLHPFMDGNGRTFVNILLNYMLMTSGLPPAIFFQPNIFDIYHRPADAIKAAISNTLKLYSGENKLFGFPNLEGSAADEMNEIIKRGLELYVQYKLQKSSNHPSSLTQTSVTLFSPNGNDNSMTAEEIKEQIKSKSSVISRKKN